MCGIAGICQWSGAPIDKHRLLEMVHSLVHRGPDGFGLFIDGPVGLGHQQPLDYYDPTLGQQPMVNESASVVVSFNGEIYNYKELRTELKGLGYQFQTDSDTKWSCMRTWHGASSVEADSMACGHWRSGMHVHANYSCHATE